MVTIFPEVSFKHIFWISNIIAKNLYTSVPKQELFRFSADKGLIPNKRPAITWTKSDHITSLIRS